MHTYEVGTLYNPNKTVWDEAVQFNIRDGQCELLMFFNRPSFDEVLAVKKSACEFGVMAIENAIFLLYRFGSQIPWSDQPFSVHLIPEDERILPELRTDETRLTLQIILVEANTGKIKVLRLVSLSPEFSAELLKLTQVQFDTPFNHRDYDQLIARIYQRFPNTNDLLKECFVFTSGGI